jgi:hypothetical protein
LLSKPIDHVAAVLECLGDVLSATPHAHVDYAPLADAIELTQREFDEIGETRRNCAIATKQKRAADQTSSPMYVFKVVDVVVD